MIQRHSSGRSQSGWRHDPRFRQDDLGPRSQWGLQGSPNWGYLGPEPDGSATLGEGDHAWLPATSGSGRRPGPKGYQRSDVRLLEDICERLMHCDCLDASDVSVTVQGGIVRLEGSVPHRGMKYAIEDVVDHCWGVDDIDNRLRVGNRSDSRAASTPSSGSTPATGPTNP
jgi:hypothetical protein